MGQRETPKLHSSVERGEILGRKPRIAQRDPAPQLRAIRLVVRVEIVRRRGPRFERPEIQERVAERRSPRTRGRARDPRRSVRPARHRTSRQVRRSDACQTGRPSRARHRQRASDPTRVAGERRASRSTTGWLKRCRGVVVRSSRNRRSARTTRWDPATPEGPTYRAAPMTASSLRG